MSTIGEEDQIAKTLRIFHQSLTNMQTSFNLVIIFVA